MNDWHKEFRVVRETVGVADLSEDRSRLRVTGGDRVTFLHGQCTNDIKNLKMGQSCYAAFLTAKGKMRGDATIVCLEDALLLETDRQIGKPLAVSLEKYVITEDVELQDVSDQLGELTLQGPKAEEVTQKIAGNGVIIFPHNRTGELGFDIVAPAGRVSQLRQRCVDAGAIEVSLRALELLRIDAGIPKYGVDMDENTIPVEAGLDTSAISYTKGCYIGQETIARIKTYGHVNRHLAQLILTASEAPLPGTPIEAESKQVGKITSAAISPRLEKAIVLGYVRRELAKPGTKVKVGGYQAEVIKLCRH